MLSNAEDKALIAIISKPIGDNLNDPMNDNLSFITGIETLPPKRKLLALTLPLTLWKSPSQLVNFM